MWTIRKISEVLNSPCALKDCKIDQIQFDSRIASDTDCFIAIDKGHDYLKSTKAAITIGERDADIIVPHSQEALNQLALYSRSQTNAKIIAITGSVGKTSTKHFLYQLLRQVYPDVVASEKSFNNHLGVPLTLCRLTPSTPVGIFEVGANNPGEISALTKMVQPDIALITNISEAHIGQYPNGLQGILNEKFSIADYLKGPLLIAPDVPKKREAIVANLDLLKEIDTISLPEHHRSNVALVLEVLKLLNIDKATLDFSVLTVGEGRGTVSDISLSHNQKITILDHTYNAPFLGVKAALTELASFNKRRKIAVLGDMGELGDHEEQFHQQVLDHARHLNIDMILPYGKIFSSLMKREQATLEEIETSLQNDDVLLLKGARFEKMENIIKQLKKRCS